MCMYFGNLGGIFVLKKIGIGLIAGCLFMSSTALAAASEWQTRPGDATAGSGSPRNEGRGCGA